MKAKYKFQYDINAILSDLIYARVLEPASKRSSFKAASEFLERPSYELHDIYRALDVLGSECDLIQSEVYKNSNFLVERNDKVLYYDCSNYYFEIEQEDGSKRYGKSKKHRPNPIIQMGLFMDGDGIPLAFSTFPGNANEQTSLRPLEKKVLGEFGCQKFIYCSDAGLASEDIRNYNHMGERSFIVTQSIKKLSTEDRSWALDPKGFKRISDDKPVDITKIPADDPDLYYKDEPYTTKKLHQRLIITYSPKYLQDENRIKAHFLICFLALLSYRILEKKLDYKYTCETLLGTLKSINFAEIQEQGLMPLYKRETITDDLHAVCGFRTDYQFITKSQMKTIQKRSKGRE